MGAYEVDSILIFQFTVVGPAVFGYEYSWIVVSFLDISGKRLGICLVEMSSK